MNKKQLISIIRTEVLLAKSSPERKGYIAGLEEAINIIEGFSDEPQKPVVPQYVAHWIEYVRGWNKGLLYALANASDEVLAWLCVDKLKRQELFACAWLDGYEVEREKRYLVKMKGVNEECEYLVFGELSNTWKLRSLGSFGELRKHHTRKELEDAGFGEVFNSPLFEVEEVE